MEEVKYYSIGQAGHKAGVKPSTIRFWEEKIGKLHTKEVERPRGNNRRERRFTELDIQRIRTIRAMSENKGLYIVGIIKELKEIDFFPSE